MNVAEPHCPHHTRREPSCRACQSAPKVGCWYHTNFVAGCASCRVKNGLPAREPTEAPSPVPVEKRVPLTPKEEIGRAFIDEIGSDRYRAWWEANFSFERTADWLVACEEADLLAIQTLSPNGFNLAQCFREKVAGEKRAARAIILHTKRQSMANARAALAQQRLAKKAALIAAENNNDR